MMTRRRFSLLAMTLPLGVETLARAQPPPEFPGQAEIAQKQDAWKEAHRLPISLVRVEGDRKLYSGSVNAVHRWADAGDETYLATGLGIKRVSKKAGIAPRHYLLQDGLPPWPMMNLVADAKGAYALLDGPNEHEYLYGLDLRTDRWKSLADWPKTKADGSGGGVRWKEGLLALGKDVVLAAPRTIETRSDSVLICIGREDGLVRTLPWDPLIRADRAALHIGYLACHEKTLTLGTDIGLLEIPLSADGGSWTRSLASHEVRSGQAGGGRLYLWLEPRNLSMGNWRSDSDGNLHLYYPETGQLQPLPPSPLPLSGAYTIVDGNGTFWMVRRQFQSGEDPYRNYVRIEAGDQEALFWRWPPGDSRWMRLRPDGTEVAAAPSPALENRPYFGPDFTLPAVARADSVPDAPARLAALNAFIAWGDIAPPFGPWAGPSIPPPIRWMKERFPHWLSPDATSEVPGLLHVGSRFFAEAVVDRKNPQIVWLGAEPGFLGTFPATSLSALPLPPSGQTPRSGRWSVAPHTPPLTRVALPGRKMQLHVSARQALSLPDGSTLLRCNHTIFRVSERGRRWDELTLPPLSPEDKMPSLQSSEMFSVGKEVYLSYWREPCFLRLDLKTRAFVRTEISRARQGNFVGTNETEMWWHRGMLAFQTLEPGMTLPQERKPQNVPKGFSPYGNPALASGRLWFYGHLDGKQVLLGWHPRTETWTRPLPVVYYDSNIAPLSDGRGGACIALRPKYDAKEIVIHRWDARSDQWSAVATVPTAREEKLQLAAAGSDGLWLVSDTHLKHLAPKAKTLQEFPLPFTNPPSVYGMRREISARDGAIFQATDGGLYRFDRRRRVWEEWKRPIDLMQLQPQVLAADTEAIWGRLAAPSMVVTPLFRFVPATRRFDVFDGTAGLPEQTEGRLVAAEKSVWFLHGTGAFRHDLPSGKFVREAELRAEHLAVSEDAETVWIAGYVPKNGGSYAVHRWERATGKTTLEKPSTHHGCQALLTSGRGVILGTWQGLFRSEKPDAWEPIDTLGLSTAALHRSADGAVWVSDNTNFLRIDAHSGL